MPFDSIGTVVLELDPLVRLGITPIPQDTVKAYKTDYRARRLATNGSYAQYRELIRWRTVRPGKRTLDQFLANPLVNVNFYSPDGDDRGMPAPLVRLAHRVHAELPAAEFSVDYLSGDPILQVEYESDGKKVKACLGIWENRAIKMIAKTE